MRLTPATSAARRKAFELWAAPSRLPPSQWMESEYVISSEESAEPGRYSFARYAYLRDPLDWFADPDIEMIALPKAAQTGWTTGFTGFVGSVIANDPCRVLVALPTESEAEVWSKDRLVPNLASSPSLREKIRPAKSRDGSNRVLHKKFAGGALKIVGANSSTGLSSWPAKYAFCDETDRYPLSAGGEGDPIALVRKRLQTWLRRGGKLGIGSTPKIEQTSIIWHYYLLGDQRRWHVPCPHCDAEQTLEWENLRWDEGKPETAAYYCPECGAAWSDIDRLIAVSKGHWRSTATPQDPKIRSAWIDGFLSPHVTHGEMATAWRACETDEQRQAFVNLYLGRPWKVRGDAPDWQRLYDRREDWPDNKLPAGALFLTAGVDVQRDRIEARVIAWGRGRQSWLADRRILMGDTSRAETWAQLNEVLDSSWPHVSGAELKIARMAVDSGYAAAEVYRWAKRHPARVLVIKGMPDGFRQPIGVPALAEVAGRKRSRSGTKVWPVGGGYIKEMLYGWLRLDAPVDGQPYPPGYVHLPKWADDSEIKQITSEELVTEKTRHGFAKQVWSKVRERNEALDCWIYAYAAACQIGIERFGDARWQQFEMTLGEAAPPPSATAPAPADRPQDEAGAAQEAPARKVVLPVGPAKRQRQVVMRSL